MSTGRQVTYYLNLNSNVIQSLQAHEVAAKSLDNSMWQIQKTLSAFGVGLGAHYLKDFVEGMIEGAGEFETAMLRIKNASEGLNDGIKNQLFISKEVDDFKTDLQSTLDSYGSFLFKIKNANLGGDVSRHLFENLQIISKVGALPQQELDATVRNISIMLGEGILEARHLRGLSYVHPQVLPFLADEMGLKDTKDATKMQQISQMISSGKLTKAALPADLILAAIEKYAESVKGGLPEALKTITSETHALSNSWFKLKNEITIDLKPELIAFFHELEGGIHWLKEHKEGVEAWGKVLFEILKVWGEYKILQLAINLGSSAWAAGQRLIIGNTVTQTVATTSLNAEMAILNENMVYAIALQSQMAVGMGLITEAQQVAFMNNLNLGSGSVTGSSVGSSSKGIGGVISGGLMNVFIAGMALQVIDALIPGNKFTKEGVELKDWLGFGNDGGIIAGGFKKTGRLTQEQSYNDALKYYIEEGSKGDVKYDILTGKITQPKIDPKGHELMNAILTSQNFINKEGGNYNFLSALGLNKDKFGNLDESNLHIFDILKAHGITPAGYFDDKSSSTNSRGKNNKINLGKPEHIRGNSSYYITINIDEMNGMNNPKFEVKNMTDMKDIEETVGITLTKMLTDVVNDSQLVGHHGK